MILTVCKKPFIGRPVKEKKFRAGIFWRWAGPSSRNYSLDKGLQRIADYGLRIEKR
jgi:hypothetical protein